MSRERQAAVEPLSLDIPKHERPLGRILNAVSGELFDELAVESRPTLRCTRRWTAPCGFRVRYSFMCGSTRVSAEK